MDDLIDHRETLAAALERLEQDYERARQRMQEDNDRQGLGLMPEEMRTMDGQFILLDALAAIVQARTALVMAETVRDS